MTLSQLSPTGRFEKILVASDKSEYTESAEQLAIDLAKITGAHLTIMNMVLSNPEYDVLAADLLAKKEQETSDFLLNFKNKAEKQGVVCEPLLMRGLYPHDEILEAAEKINADLIIMGRRGHRGLARLMVGDATARVVAEARCQVLVVPRHTNLWKKRILLATDGSRFSDAAAVTACILAKLTEVPLIVMNACVNTSYENLCIESERIIARVVQHANAQGVTTEASIIEGQPVQAILDAIQRQNVDLLIGGSHGKTGMKKVFLGSVMERVIGKATCPVLTVKG
ncbi:MAG: universal stress protein [Magnetococcus sp. DMHC-6]